jgi:hypothetical protein
MPKLVRLYITQVLVGFALALAFVALLLGLDVAGLRHLVLGTEMGWLGGVMLFVFNGIVFAGVQFGISIMRLAEDEDGAPPGGRRTPADDGLLLVPLRAEPRRR